MNIRDERPEDRQAIFDLTTEAFAPMPFSNGSEPGIINALRNAGDLTLSLVAIQNGVIVGHITFSPVSIAGNDGQWLGLGPVSVAISEQSKGIGSALILEGLEQTKALGANGCALVGNPDYYSRFGFQSDGNLTYEALPTRVVQWVSFKGSAPKGELKFSPAFNQ